jgi:hypothetical protein
MSEYYHSTLQQEESLGGKGPQVSSVDKECSFRSSRSKTTTLRE